MPSGEVGKPDPVITGPKENFYTSQRARKNQRNTRLVKQSALSGARINGVCQTSEFGIHCLSTSLPSCKELPRRGYVEERIIVHYYGVYSEFLSEPTVSQSPT